MAKYIIGKRGLRYLNIGFLREKSYEELLEEAWTFSTVVNKYSIPVVFRNRSTAKAHYMRLMRWYPDLDAYQVRKIVCASFGCDNWFELMIQLERLEQ